MTKMKRRGELEVAMTDDRSCYLENKSGSDLYRSKHDNSRCSTKRYLKCDDFIGWV